MVQVRSLALPEVLELRPKKFGDDRGFFSETWSSDAFEELGLELTFVQDNHSYSAAKGVLRGLHYQLPPAIQDKLVRVTRGSIYDVAVDIRQGSSTFGHWVGLEVSAREWNQIFVPKGFAHGFVTLEDHTEVQYKVTGPYRPDLDRSIRYDDPELRITWPIASSSLMLSAKDAAAPTLAQVDEVL